MSSNCLVRGSIDGTPYVAVGADEDALPVYALNVLGRNFTGISWPGLLRFTAVKQAREAAGASPAEVERRYGPLLAIA